MTVPRQPRAYRGVTIRKVDDRHEIDCPFCGSTNRHIDLNEGQPVHCCAVCEMHGVPPFYPDRTITLVDCGHTFYLDDAGTFLGPK